MEIKKAKSVPLPITGNHAGHEVTLNTKVLYVQVVTGVNSHGDITINHDGEVDYANFEPDPFFYCETCQMDLSPGEVGISEEWDVL